MSTLSAKGLASSMGLLVAMGAGTVAIAATASAEVPTCVRATYSNPAGPYQDVYVKNSCPGTIRVKVLWSPGTDSRCYSIAPNQQIKDHHLNQWLADKWDGLRSC